MKDLLTSTVPLDEPTPELLHETRIEAVKAYRTYETLYNKGSDDAELLTAADDAITAMGDYIEALFRMLDYMSDIVMILAGDKEDGWPETKEKYLN